ncbi:MAG: hypothetical protein ACOC0C_02810 [Bacteroidota bacterium]
MIIITNRFTNLLLLSLLALFSCNDQNEATGEKNVFVFYYFEGNSGERAGLFAAYSRDLNAWHKLADSLVAPSIGEWGVFRDPSVIRTDDGTFHLAWTSGKSGFGYASSQDGIHWENIRYVPVVDSARGMVFANVWAPELYTDGEEIIILWSSTLMKDYIPPEEPAEWWTAVWDHRMYYTKTTDFQSFAPTKKFWDPGFNAIDGSIYPTDSLFYLFFKDERKTSKKVVMAESENLFGPYRNIREVGCRYSEGAIAVSTDTMLVLYYDNYHENNGYRYVTTRNMKKWSDEIIPEKAQFNDVFRHGSIVQVTEKELENMLKTIKNK